MSNYRVADYRLNADLITVAPPLLLRTPRPAFTLRALTSLRSLSSLQKDFPSSAWKSLLALAGGGGREKGEKGSRRDRRTRQEFQATLERRANVPLRYRVMHTRGNYFCPFLFIYACYLHNFTYPLCRARRCRLIAQIESHAQEANCNFTGHIRGKYLVDIRARYSASASASASEKRAASPRAYFAPWAKSPKSDKLRIASRWSTEASKSVIRGRVSLFRSLLPFSSSMFPLLPVR